MNLKKINVITFFALICFASFITAEQKKLDLPKTSVRVAFSPDDGVTKMITEELDNAKESIEVAAYSFTSMPIAEKLISAHKRGVGVRIVLDGSQRTAKGSVAKDLIDSGIAVRFNDCYKIQHNKYMIIDRKHVECGSFNYTKSAEKSNAENAIVILDTPEFAKVYIENFEKLWNDPIHKPRKKRKKVWLIG
ncbi:MAG: hypothetical protein NEHIOOID_01036 [Holosporales bacterium]